MEYVEGGDLFGATEGLDPRGVVQLVLQVCLGLEYIHSRGYIHCDVKPANLLVAGAPPRSVRIVDLGLAQFESESIRQLPRGTVHFMAPEQFRGGPIDRRADLYSLGVVLYQLLSRRLPFPGDTASEVIQKRLETHPPPIRVVRNDVPAPLEEVVLRLLSRDPADRPPTAASAAQEIADAVGIEFRPDARPVRESYILSGRFVGRQDALDRLRGLLPGRSRSNDRPRAVAVVHGPVGIGKSRLLRELRQHAQLSEMPVHAVSCGHGGAPIMALLASVAEAVGPRIEVALERSPDVRALLEAPGVPTIPADRDALDPEKERLKLVQGIAGILLEAARLRPFVGAIEDLHAADDFSLEVLHQIARSAYFGAASPASLLLVCSRTPELEEGQPSAQHLARLIADPAVLTIELGPLTRDDTAQLVTSMLGEAAIPEGFVEALHAESSGNPLFLEEYMRALVDQEVVQYRSGRWRFAPGDARRVPVPPSIEAVLRQRLAGIGRERMRLLFAISCFPERVALPIVQALLGPGETLYEGLDSLERRGLLVREPGPAFRFAHGWTREQVYKSIPQRRRRRIHEAIARTLIDASLGDWRGRPEEVAWHLLRGPTPEDALDSLLASGARARAAHQNARAASLFEDALGLLKRNEGPRKKAVLENLATLYGLMGDTDRAVRSYRQLLGMARSDHDPADVARTCRKLAEVLASKGEHDESDGWLGRALAALPKEDAAERARILQQSAWSKVQRGRYQDGIRTCEEALTLCGDSDDERTKAAVLNVLGTAEFSVGDFAPAFEHLEQSLAIREKADNLQGVAGSLLNLGVSYYYAGNLARARQALERTRAISEKIGDIRVTAYAQNNLGLVLHAMGRRDEALVHYRESLEIQRRLGNPAGIVPCLVNIGNLHRERPDVSAALASFEEALSYAQLTDNAQGKALSWNNLSEVYLYLGDLPKAEEMAESARGLAHERRSRREEAFVEALLGQIAAHRQRWEEAVERLSGCIDLFVRINMRSNAGDAVLALAETLARKGDRAACLKMLDRIRSEFEEQRPPAFLAWMEFLRGTCTDGPEAEKCLKDAGERCADAGILEPTWQVRHALARIAHRRGDHVAAGRLYKQALDCLRQVFATVPGPYRASFFSADERQQLRRDIISLKADSRRIAPTQAEETRKRLNATVSLLKEENRRLSGLIEVNKRMNTEHDLDRILSFIVDTAV
ncbi:MAG: tetratricopeptide repeat protein, partial [Planctomycetota bacterium]